MSEERFWNTDECTSILRLIKPCVRDIYRFQRVLCKLSCLLSFHLLLEHSGSGHSSVRVPMGSSFHSVSAFLKMYSKSTKAFWT